MQRLLKVEKLYVIKAQNILFAAGGLRVLRTTQAGEDHFSLVEKLAKADYSLTRDLIRMFSSTYN